MALKPSQITRRNFVQRAGLLVSALGVGASVQTGLMDAIVKKATRKWGSEALAAEPNAVAFHVEILLRAGFQLNSLFPSLGHADATTKNQALNIYSTPAMINQVAITGANPNANKNFFAKYVAGQGADALGTYIASKNGAYGIATSECVALQNGQHTGNFASRAPNSGLPAPAVMHAALGPSAPVTGIEWNNGTATTNQRGMYPALATVKDEGTLQGLYKDLPMYFTRPELALIAGAFDPVTGALSTNGAIDDFDKMFVAKSVPGSVDVAAVSVSGRNQAQLSVLTALQNKKTAITVTQPNFTVGGVNSLAMSMGGTNLALGLANAAAAFSAGVLTSFTISLDSNDWHGDISNMNDPTGKQGLWNLYMGNAITGFLKSMDQLTSPLYGANAKPMSESFLLSVSSEFTRTPNRNGGGSGSDNGDGGNAGFAFIGSKVKSGAYGNITGAGGVVGFDPTTGAMNAGSTITEAMIWKTHASMMGISDTTINGMMPTGAIIKAMVK